MCVCCIHKNLPEINIPVHRNNLINDSKNKQSLIFINLFILDNRNVKVYDVYDMLRKKTRVTAGFCIAVKYYIIQTSLLQLIIWNGSLLENQHSENIYNQQQVIPPFFPRVCSDVQTLLFFSAICYKSHLRSSQPLKFIVE